MRAVAPEVETVEQPVQFLGAQRNGLVGGIRRCFETLGIQVLEPKSEAVVLPIQNLHPVAGLVKKNKKHRIQYRHLYVKLDQRGEAVDGFSEVPRVWGERYTFSTLASGRIMAGQVPEGIGSTASGVSEVL
jgi:hypothetical protein